MKDYRGLSFPLPGEFREQIINDLTKTIENEQFISRSKDGRKGFSRKRKISFNHLIVLLTQGLSRSLQRELNTFYHRLQGSDFSIQHVSKSAFTHARKKLKPEAFKELNKVGTDSFYQNAPYLTHLGYRLLSIDGSTLMLPKHSSVEEEFGVDYFGPDADSPRSIATLSVLYDVLNLVTLDCELGKYRTSEKELLLRHLHRVEPGKDLLLLDRGYAGLGLMFELQCLGIDYCVRLQDDWWLEVRKMIESGESDKIVTFKLPDKSRHLASKYNREKNIEIKCRLVIVELEDGTKEVLCTSVLDRKALPYNCFKELYHFRWGVEEAYKLYKSRVKLEAFSGKTAKAIKQDVFARVFMMTVMAVLAFPIEEKVRREYHESKNRGSRRKHAHKINRTNALAMVRETCKALFIDKLTAKALVAFDAVVKATTEIIRPGRKVPRKKYRKRPPSMNYKQL